MLILKVLTLFLLPVISSSAPYLGEGILHQKPPSPYRGDVILYPEPNTPPLPLPFLFTSYSINTNPGWDTTLYVENVDIAFSDVIEVKEIIGAEVVLRHTIHDGDRITLNLTGTQFSVDVRLLGPGSKTFRLRWISVPEGKTVHGGFIDNAAAESGISWSYPDISTLLVNLLEDGETLWYINVGNHSQVELQAGVQMINTSSLTLGERVSFEPVNQNLTSSNTDLLLEWFPYEDSNHISYKGVGCTSLTAKELAAGERLIVWDLKLSDDIFHGTSLSLTFINVTSSSYYVMKVMVDGDMFLKATTSIATSSQYHIPVSNTTVVRLELEPTEMSAFLLCYEPSSETEFSATGYLKSPGYPNQISNAELSSHIEGFPLPVNWSVTFEQMELELQQYRAWLDVMLLHGGSQKELIQSYTGSKLELGGVQIEGGVFVNYNRYPPTRNIWQGFYQNIQPLSDLSGNEIVAVFQQTSAPELVTSPGYSMKWTISHQKPDQGVNTTYFVGDSGYITSPNYPLPYYSGASNIYDIKISDTVRYNAIQLLYGLSYTERNSDILRYRDRQEVTLELIKLPDRFMSGNLTNLYLTIKSSHILINFETDQRKEYMGFNITWRALYIDVNGTTPAPPGTQSSTSMGAKSVTDPVINGGEDNSIVRISRTALIIIVVLVLGTLLTLLALAVALIIRYRIQLSDVYKEGFIRPTYKPTVDRD